MNLSIPIPNYTVQMEANEAELENSNFQQEL